MGLEQANDETLAVNFGWALGARLIAPASAGA